MCVLLWNYETFWYWNVSEMETMNYFRFMEQLLIFDEVEEVVDRPFFGDYEGDEMWA